MPQAARKTEATQASGPAPRPTEQQKQLTAEQVVERLRPLIEQTSTTDVAQRIGTNSGSLSRLMAGERAWSAAMLSKARTFLALESLKLADEGVGRLVRTATADAIRTVAQYCQIEQSIGVIEGTSGAGKTCGCHRYAASNAAAVYVHASYAVNSPSRMLDELWRLAGFRHAAGPRPSRAGAGKGKANRKPAPRKSRRSLNGKQQYDMLVERWRVPPGEASARVLLVDDAHVLGYGTLELLRSLHDDTRIGIVLVATTRLEATVLLKGDAHQMYEQIRGRVMIRKTVGGVDLSQAARVARAKRELADVMAAWLPEGVTLTAAAIDWLFSLASGARAILGGYRVAKAHVRMVQRSKSLRGKSIDVPQLEQAHQRLTGAGEMT